jgi:hypothetical protein
MTARRVGWNGDLSSYVYAAVFTLSQVFMEIVHDKRRIYEKIVFIDQLMWQEPIKHAIILTLTQTYQQTCFLAFLASSPLLYLLVAAPMCIALHVVAPLLICNSPELTSPAPLRSFEFFML